MEEQAKIKLIASCGLYCGNCRSFTKGKCPGCAENTKAKWCKIRTCCLENHYSSCADCTSTNSTECKKLNNFASKIFEVLFRSDRPTSIQYIQEFGADAYIKKMDETKQMVFKKN